MFIFFRELPLWFYIGLDMIFVIVLFLPDGDFWDKLRGLFSYNFKETKSLKTMIITKYILKTGTLKF